MTEHIGPPNPEPADPWNPLRTEAVALYGLMEVYESVGFTRAEAFELTAVVWRGRDHSEDDDEEDS